MGLGRHGGGVAAARFLAQHGAQLTITDRARQTDLAGAIESLANLPVRRWRMGEHHEDDFRQASLLIVNPAVRPGHPLVELARQSGAAICSEIELFLQSCPARVIGVTGSNGKSTTASMIAAIARSAGRGTWLGGNIGVSLLPQIGKSDDALSIQPDDCVVLELSSAQLHWLSPHCRIPELGVVLNCTPNHLDWHGDFASYAAAKQRLLRANSLGDALVLNPEDAEVDSWRALTERRIVDPAPDDLLPPLKVAGRHNRINARCAAAAAHFLGINDLAIRDGLQNFIGLSHRQQRIAARDGRIFVDDSKATTPEAAMAALHAHQRPTWLLAGGDGKGVDFSRFAADVIAKCRGAALFGADRQRLAQAILAQLSVAELSAAPTAAHEVWQFTVVETLQQALEWCWSRSQSGDRILLSPACASLDQFRDYAHRGESFRQMVAELCTVERSPKSNAAVRESAVRVP